MEFVFNYLKIFAKKEKLETNIMLTEEVLGMLKKYIFNSKYYFVWYLKICSRTFGKWLFFY